MEQLRQETLSLGSDEQAELVTILEEASAQLPIVKPPIPMEGSRDIFAESASTSPIMDENIGPDPISNQNKSGPGDVGGGSGFKRWSGQTMDSSDRGSDRESCLSSSKIETNLERAEAEQTEPRLPSGVEKMFREAGVLNKMDNAYKPMPSQISVKKGKWQKLKVPIEPSLRMFLMGQMATDTLPHPVQYPDIITWTTGPENSSPSSILIADFRKVKDIKPSLNAF